MARRLFDVDTEDPALPDDVIAATAASEAEMLAGSDQRFVTPATVHLALPFVDVREHGAVGDGSTDDTTAIQAAITATPAGGTLYFPAGFWLFSALTCTESITLLGEGWEHRTNAAFGEALYLDEDRMAGTILLCTATSGAGITFSSGGGATRRPVVKHLAVIGPGTGTSIGLQIGVNGSGTGVAQAHIEDVLVANFAVGADLDLCYDGTFSGLRFRGCSTGITLTQANQNDFYNLEVQYSSVHSVDGTVNAAVNCFYGGLLQNISGTSGMTFAGEANHVTGFYVEAASPPTDIFVLDGTNCSLTFSRMSTTPGVRIKAPDCVVMGCRGAGSTELVVDGASGGHGAVLIANSNFAVTDATPRTSGKLILQDGTIRADLIGGWGPNIVGRSGDYWSPPSTRTTTALVAGTMYTHPVSSATARLWDRIGAEVTGAAASSTITLGIYADDGEGSPGALLLDAGTIDGNSATAQEITISFVPEPGKTYHLAALCIGGTPTVRTHSVGNWSGRNNSLANATAAAVVRNGTNRTGLASTSLPDPAAANTVAGQVPVIALRLGA